MGFIREPHGRITVESRSESFYVHASYGYGQGICKIKDLPLGATFEHPQDNYREWQVTGQVISGHTFIKPCYETMEGLGNEVSSHLIVTPTGSYAIEKFDEDEPLARLWHDHPHPEFANEDLDDLIAALVAYRKDLP